jgi:hypothetical protein
MIQEFPPDYELLAFFEAEPTVLDAGVPWIYNTLDFTTTHDGIEVHVGSFRLTERSRRACLSGAWSLQSSNCATSKPSALFWTRDVRL